jgi:hypothetical protein
MVESVSTPAAVDVEHRVSFNGETFDYEDQEAPASRPGAALLPGLSTQVMKPDTELPSNAVSRRDLLQVGLTSPRPLTQVTRSSGMTTSDLSRMSGLSDFPLPPESSLPTLTPHHHIPVFNTYHEDERNVGAPQPNAAFSRPEYVEPPRSGPAGSPVMSRGLIPQVEFGVNQSAVELAKSLSSPEPM